MLPDQSLQNDFDLHAEVVLAVLAPRHQRLHQLWQVGSQRLRMEAYCDHLDRVSED